MGKTLVEQFTCSEEGMKLFQQERIILETTELICKIMEERSINKAELAMKLGRSKGYITQLLDGSANMTLRTISDVMWALNGSLYVEAGPLSIEAHDPQINFQIENEDCWRCNPSRQSKAYDMPKVSGSSIGQEIRIAG